MTKRDITKKYNQQPEGVELDLDGTPLPFPTLCIVRWKLYKDHITEVAKRRTDKFDWRTEKNCWYCGEFPKMQTPLNTMIWCERCYSALCYNKYTKKWINPAHNTIAVGRELMEAEHKEVPKKQKPDEYTKYFDEYK